MVVRSPVLIYNPASGGQRERRMRVVETVLGVLRAGGIDAQAIATHGPASAIEQAREAVAGGCDAVIVCGGDGTVNEVLQGIAGSGAALGIVPLGTGNVLARDLGLPRDPAAAARLLLESEPQLVTAGRLAFQHEQHLLAVRLFAAAAGIGPDAQIMYEMSSHSKGRFGMAAYYLKATEIWVRHRLVPFTVEYVKSEGGERVKETVYQMLAVRTGDFGALLGRMVAAASLDRHDFGLVLLRTKSRLRISQYMVGRLLRREWSVPGVSIAFATEADCTPLPSPKAGRGAPAKLYAEVDGEVVGSPPARVDVLRDAFRLLRPRKSRS